LSSKATVVAVIGDIVNAFNQNGVFTRGKC
jgi:hypothetical protein